MGNRDQLITATVVLDKDGLTTAYVALRSVARTLNKRMRDDRYSEEQRQSYKRKAWQCQLAANQINPQGLEPNAENSFRWDL